MDFVNIKDNQSERPRFLTENEVNQIVDVLPMTYSADPYEADIIREAIKADLIQKLTNKKLSPDAVNQLANDIVKYYNTSRVAAGLSVGAHAAESSSHAPMQATLNSFHFSGQSKSGSAGINGIEELLYLKKNRKFEICSIHYKNKNLTYEEVLETKKDIIGCTVNELIEDYLYIKEGQNYVKNIEIDFYRNLKKFWFHNDDYITNVIGSIVPPDDAYVLRIKLNKYQLYTYKVTIKDIIDAFKRELDTPVQFIYGAIKDQYIDIYACSDYNQKQKLEAVNCENESDPLISAAYYQTIIIPSFDTLRIKGVQGITNLTPIVIPVVSIILNDSEEYYFLNTKSNIKELLILFDLVGIQVRRQNDEYRLKMPDYDNIPLTMSESDYKLLTPYLFIEQIANMSGQPHPKITKQLLLLSSLTLTKVYLVSLNVKNQLNSGIDTDHFINLLTLINVHIIKKEDHLLYIDRPDIRNHINKLMEENPLVKRAAELIYAEVTGTNLRGLLALDIVDPQRTISNNIHVNAQVLGIRAARAYFIKDLYSIMSGFSLHPQHVLLIADVYFHKGIPTGAQNLSVSKNLGPVDKASISKPADVFKNSAIIGINHEITGVASHIIYGIPPKVGTGYFDVGIEVGKKLLTNTDIYKNFKKEEKTLLNEIDELEEEDAPLTSTPFIVGKKVVVKPATVIAPTNIMPVSRFQKPVDADKTEKKRGRKK